MLKSSKKPIHGVGINDVEYSVSSRSFGKRLMCPYYVKWHDMITRCYSPKSLTKCPTYIGCTVCDEWLVFSVFREWMVLQDWEGKQLDKDLLVEGNKVYSPDTCVFVSSSLNTLFNDSLTKRGIYPLGVSKCKQTGKFRATGSILNRCKNLGRFVTPELAHAAYCKYKKEVIKEVAQEYEHINKELYSALILRADSL